jgi:uncharacterized protein involved in exopolysaccharide biosynthesis
VAPIAAQYSQRGCGVTVWAVTANGATFLVTTWNTAQSSYLAAVNQATAVQVYAQFANGQQTAGPSASSTSPTSPSASSTGVPISTYQAIEQDIANARATIASLKTQIAAAAHEIATLQAQIKTLQAAA